MNFPELEEKILEFWKKNRIFQKSVEKDAPKGSFVFYEGPPTANGRPGIHHVEARAFKDLIPRYKTMLGYRVERKAGWDTHGLPVELEVEKELGLKNKKDVEAYGIEKFNKKCKESVWKYKEEWEKMTERIGFWVDMEDPYVTYDNLYIESLWQIIKTADEKGLLYKGYRVAPHCPRCGTGLSSHEVAQGYKEVGEESVYIKFKIKNRENEYILAWTTTPWTLPGNVALAVGKDFDYVKIRIKNEELGIMNDLILLKMRLGIIEEDYEIVEELKGKDLISLEYEPLFPGAISETSENYKNAFKVYPADFVSTTDGTGVVHTAVMYGADDYELGEKIGLPKIHTVNSDGTFNNLVKKWEGKFVKSVEKEITADLQSRGLLFKTEKYAHDYPFCWRCSTPLLYYAKDSWYFKMSALKEELLKNNSEINWIPAHIKEGRFGEWLKEVKDWAISRERYWGTPIPVWLCQKCGNKKIVGSIDEIRGELGGLNKLFLLRHGEAETNIQNISSTDIDRFSLTENGKKRVEKTAAILSGEKIDLIFSSPVLRTKETAEIVAKKLGLEIIFDERLKEIGLGKFNNKDRSEMNKIYPDINMRIENTEHGVESLTDLRARTKDFLDDINNKYKNKNILIVSHGDPLLIFFGLVQGKDLVEGLRGRYPEKGVFKIEYSKPFDLHRPYIDEVKLKCSHSTSSGQVCGGEMKRIPEVMDCWYDSGSMPFAQVHYPFENRDLIDDKKLFPADFICEAVDQTRGWFYTLLAVSTILGRGISYKNVICLGHLLDKNGQKMSKSKGNVVNPGEMINKYGADTVRWYIYTVIQAGEPIRFDEKGLLESRKMFMTLVNVLAFYKMFSNELSEASYQPSENVLDKWVLAKLNLLAKEVSVHLEAYDITGAARKIEKFILDLSQWYVRRSRDRFKSADEKEKNAARETLGRVLYDLALLLAPFAPFTAEHVYKELGFGAYESVHLENWPRWEKQGENAYEILDEMDEVRKIVEIGLALRSSLKIKVRQPLKELRIKNKELRIKNSPELLGLIKDEVNVKEIVFSAQSGPSSGWEVELDTNITEELKEEGELRELTRAIQDLRKKEGLKAGEKISLIIETDNKGRSFVEKFENEIKSATNLSEIKVNTGDAGFKLEIRN